MFTSSIKFVALVVKLTANHTHYFFYKFNNYMFIFCGFKTKFMVV